MSKLKIGLSVMGVVVIALVAGFFGYTHLVANKVFGAANAPINSSFSTTTDSNKNYGTQDVCGTHIGTTTVGCNIGLVPNITSTYISVIGKVSQAVYQIKIVAATSSANNLSVTVQGSNDYLCETLAGNASSTTDVVQANINWYDAMPYLIAKGNLTSFGNGSSSLVMSWANATAGSTNILAFDNLNFNCLRFSISGSSTQPYIGLNTRAK